MTGSNSARSSVPSNPRIRRPLALGLGAEELRHVLARRGRSWRTYTLLAESVVAAKIAAAVPWTSSRQQTRLTPGRPRSVRSVSVPAGEIIARETSL